MLYVSRSPSADLSFHQPCKVDISVQQLMKTARSLLGFLKVKQRLYSSKQYCDHVLFLMTSFIWWTLESPSSHTTNIGEGLLKHRPRHSQTQPTSASVLASASHCGWQLYWSKYCIFRSCTMAYWHTAGCTQSRQVPERMPNWAKSILLIIIKCIQCWRQQMDTRGLASMYIIWNIMHTWCSGHVQIQTEKPSVYVL